VTRAGRDEAGEPRDLLAGTDFFGAPRSKDGGVRARSRTGDTGEFRTVGDPADSGRGRHRDPEPRRRAAPSVASGAAAGVAGAVAARAATTGGPASRGRAQADPGRSRFGAVPSSSDAPGPGSAETELVVRPARTSPVAARGRLAGLRALLRRRWFAPSFAGGAVLCSVAFVTGVAQFAGTACAAVPPAGETTSGQATFYDGGTGNCSYPTLPADDLYVALGPDEYSEAGACGGYLDVTGPSGSVRVKIVDQCPECEAGHIDLSREAFTRIADPEDGLVPVTYGAVADPAVPGKLSVRVKEGSSAFWLAILIDNHGNPLSKVEVSGSAGFTALSRTSFNYWVADGGLGAGPFSVRVTDTAGRTATIPNVTLSPGTVQQSGVALGGGTPVTAPTTEAAAPLVSPRSSAGPTSTRSSVAAADDDSTSTTTDVPPAAGADGSPSTTEQDENDTDTAVSPDADASEDIAANPAPSSSIAVPRAVDSTAETTGRNSCG